MKTLLIPLVIAVSPALAVGDAVNGQRLYGNKCTACHSVEESIAGPAHRGVYGRQAGSLPGFAYSNALKKSKIVWDEKTLDQWLTSPEKTIPGQAMGISVSDPQERQDLIAYLKTLKKNP